MHVNVTSSCVIGFLILNLLVGTYYGRKVTTLKQYVLGGSNFTTGALVSTVVGTWIGGDFLFITLEEVYNTGLLYCIGCLGMSLSLFITGYFLVPRMKNFLGNISIASSMGKLYGRKARLITAFTGAIISAPSS